MREFFGYMPTSPDDFPIRIGTPAEFASVRGFFDDIQFNDHAVCAALKVRDIAGSRDVRIDEVGWGHASPALRTMIALFVLGAPVPRDDVRSICGDEIFAAFTALGLV